MEALDVVVVGSGPAALAAAAELKRREPGVTVLERGTQSPLAGARAMTACV